MARLRIPQLARSALVQMAEISSANFQAMVEGFRIDGPLVVRSDLTRRLLDRTVDLDEDDVAEFIDLTLSLASLRVDRDITAEQLAEEISAASDLRVPDEKRSELRERIAVLLQVPSVQQLSKAADLLARDERVFHEARVTTDMRPIFEEDPSTVPQTAVILHNLTIVYHTSRGVEEWQVALDEADLLSLHNVVDRAVQKGRTLHKLMDAAHIMGFEPLE